jgi:opacity protein-like surface antigen
MRYFLFFMLILSFTEIYAQKSGDVFGGLTYTQASIKDESSTDFGTFKPSVVGLGLAYVVADNLAIDANVFDGRSESSNTKSLVNVTVKSKNGYGFGIRPFMVFNESWGGYAKLGRLYGAQETSTKIGTRSSTTKTESYARTTYGLGVSYNINARWGVSSEYMWSIKEESESYKNTSVSLGVRYKF